MPFTRISLLKGRSPDFIRKMSDRFHQAMVETFNVPATDRFQAVHQHEPGELVFDPTYFSEGRSDGFVVFHVATGKPRDTATKKAFYRRVVELLAEAPGLRPEDVMVIVSESPGENWSFSGGLAQMAPGAGA